ncbi:hypothetical protein INT43_007908 [Umbelopsis isabellina]|uniref:Oxidoreductase n=1 Tax=Mortierella isabellina TaxID=91625 RepID=A0A8H7PNL9_MORIS|nr:hypothetical protein INT43_007908 [Umbelopsis isabellina]
MSQEKKVVVVTGCSQGGIGYNLCEQFAAQGCRVFATARRIEAMSGLEAFGCEKVKLDVTDEASIKAAFEEIYAKAGHVDILVNNAGAHAIGALLDTDMKMARRCLDVNIFGTLGVCKEVGRRMAERRSGTIVNIGSVVGYVATPWAGIYCLSKAAIHSMTDALRMELAPFGVHAMVVAPGSIKSNIGDVATASISLPEDSLFTRFRKSIETRATSSQAPGCTPTDVFAKNVVNAVMKPRPRNYFTYGRLSTIFLIFYHLPAWLKDTILSRMLGVSKVKISSKND